MNGIKLGAKEGNLSVINNIKIIWIVHKDKAGGRKVGRLENAGFGVKGLSLDGN